MSRVFRRPGALGLVAALGLALALSGCSGDHPKPPQSSERLSPPTAQPSGGAQGAANVFGLKWNWSQTSTFPYARQTSGGMTFFEVEWCDVEPQQGVRKWQRVDRIVEQSQSLGYQLLLKIRSGSCWATGRSGSGPDVLDRNENTRKQPSAVPSDFAAYRAFVTEVVKRYSSRGVHSYAIENEVDAANFWVGSFSEYQQVVTAGAAAVHAADSKAVVLDGGISSTGYGVAIAASMLAKHQDNEALDFYRQYYARRQQGSQSRFAAADSVAGLRSIVDSKQGRRASEALAATFALAKSGVIDAYQLHYYESWTLAQNVLSFIRANIPASEPIEAWEVGVAWPGNSFDENAQADETVKLLVTMLLNGVRRVVYLPLAYTPGGDRQVFRGLVQPDGTELPAGVAYRLLVQAASGSRSTTPLEDKGVSGIVFDHGDHSVTVMWADAAKHVPAAAPAGAEVTSVGGDRVDWSTNGLDLGPKPLFVRVDAAGPTAARDFEQAIGAS